MRAVDHQVFVPAGPQRLDCVGRRVDILNEASTQHAGDDLGRAISGALRAYVAWGSSL